jgi:hypothetical protein
MEAGVSVPRPHFSMPPQSLPPPFYCSRYKQCGDPWPAYAMDLDDPNSLEGDLPGATQAGPPRK